MTPVILKVFRFGWEMRFLASLGMTMGLGITMRLLFCLRVFLGGEVY